MPSSYQTKPAARSTPGPGGDGALPLLGVAVVAAALVSLILGFAVARAVFGDGWFWPSTSAQYVDYLTGALTGHPGEDLALTGKPSTAQTYIVAGIVLGVALAAIILARRATRGPRDRGPGTDFGFASKAQVAAVLGPVCRQRAAEIRPDLYGRGRTPGDDGPLTLPEGVE